MTEMTVSFHTIDGSEAAIGWAGSHSLVADRPVGKAGGEGLGFNGGQLLALAIGGCLCNDLHYVAHERGVRLRSIRVDVTVPFDGDPLLAAGASVKVSAQTDDHRADVAAIIDQAKATSTVGNSLARGIPVELSVR